MSSSQPTIRAATDVGGTFTDLVYFFTDPSTGLQEVVTGKADTTPGGFEQGVLNVLAKGDASLEDIGFMAHASLRSAGSRRPSTATRSRSPSSGRN
jgi:N-methylhydantoinase A